MTRPSTRRRRVSLLLCVLTGLTLGGCSDLDPVRAVRPALDLAESDLDAALRHHLDHHGFTGRAAATLEAGSAGGSIASSPTSGGCSGSTPSRD